MLFENHPKCLIRFFQFFPTEINFSGNTIWPQLQFKNSPLLAFLINVCPLKMYVNVARYARNVEWDIFCDFQTPCLSPLSILFYKKNATLLLWFFPDQICLWSTQKQLSNQKRKKIKKNYLSLKIECISFLKLSWKDSRYRWSIDKHSVFMLRYLLSHSTKFCLKSYVFYIH